MDDFPHVDLSPLTQRQRDVIHLRYSCCLPERGIAQLLQISRSTVREHHQRALEKLAQTMSPTAGYKSRGA